MNGTRQTPASNTDDPVIGNHESPITAFLIDTAAIRNARNSLKTNNGDQL
jgi:hypothetical protein